MATGVKTKSMAEHVAESLGDLQRRALLYMPAKGWTDGPAYWQFSNTIKAMSLRENALTESRPWARRSQDFGSVLQWRLTPLGREVQEILRDSGNRASAD